MTSQRILWMGTLCFGWLLTGCPNETQVGSACPDGECGVDGAIDGNSCRFGSHRSLVHVTQDPLNPQLNFRALCLPTAALPRSSDGKVACRVVWERVLPADAEKPASMNCEGLGFGSTLPDSEDGPGRCGIDQLPVSDGKLPEGVDGWLYDDFSEEARVDCPAGRRVWFTDGAVPPSGVLVDLYCDLPVVETGLSGAGSVASSGGDSGVAALDLAVCEVPPVTSADVGEPCELASLPEQFDKGQIHVEVGSSACETRTCIAYKLRGKPSSSCMEPTVCLEPDSRALMEQVFCSCRCSLPTDPGSNADSGDGLCSCGDGFSCVDDILLGAPDGIAGGYCIRTSIIP